jgi:NADPH-dependent 2,4-dienoyl-CoA reductase/sulfur reductase-like enzyme
MYIYMGHMRYKDTKPYEDWFWEKNAIATVRDFVENIDVERKRLDLRSGRAIDYDVLLISTGSKSNKFGWPGQDLTGVQGLYGIPDLEEMERQTRNIDRAIVVGGGLIGIEMAEMLHSRQIPVTFLVREGGYMDYAMPPEESTMIGREIRRHGIDLRLETELRAGILVNEYFETSIPDVYAAGDCVEFRNDDVGSTRIEQLWYTGRMHGKTVAHIIVGRRTAYDPGPFFNSAKFFTVEWQTYGRIHPVRPDGVDTIFWADQKDARLIRIDYEAASGCVLGFNLMGIRFRHEVCERWLREKRSIDYVIDHLRKANFDPEFHKTFERFLVREFQSRQSARSYA